MNHTKPEHEELFRNKFCAFFPAGCLPPASLTLHFYFIRPAIGALLFIMVLSPLFDTAYALRGLFMERPKLGAEYNFDYSKDIRTGPFIDKETSSRRYNERLRFTTQGWYYHPALLIYSLEYTPEWEQTSEEDKTIEDKFETKEFFSGYFAELTFLKDKPYSLILSADRELTSLGSSSARQTDSESNIYNAMFRLTYPVLPLSLQYRHTDNKLTGYFESSQMRDQVTLTMSHYKHLGSTTLTTSYSDSIAETETTTVDTNDFKFALSNAKDYSENRSRVLNSYLAYSEQDISPLRTRKYSIIENFNWIHRDNLSTKYELRYEKTNSFDKINHVPQRSQAKSARFGLNHLLYENLTTTLNINATQNDAQAGGIATYESNLNFDYTRRIPYGSLSLVAGYDYKIVDNQPRLAFIEVNNESIVLKTGTVTFLSGDNIKSDSLIIKKDAVEPALTDVYVKDKDYRVTEVGRLLLIECIDEGDIDNPVAGPANACSTGATVYADYSSLFPSFDYSSLSQTYGVQLSLWDVWTVYYFLGLSKQKIISGIQPPEDLSDDSLHRAGSDLKWKWNRLIFTWEDQYTNRAPIKRWHVVDDITIKPSSRTFLSLSGNYGETIFKSTSKTDTFMGATSRLQILLTRRSMLDADIFIDKIKGPDKKIITKGLTSNFIMTYGIWIMKLSYRFSNVDDEFRAQNFNNNQFSFKIERTLF